jgi:hypothetical protein
MVSSTARRAQHLRSVPEKKLGHGHHHNKARRKMRFRLPCHQLSPNSRRLCCALQPQMHRKQRTLHTRSFTLVQKKSASQWHKKSSKMSATNTPSLEPVLVKRREGRRLAFPTMAKWVPPSMRKRRAAAAAAEASRLNGDVKHKTSSSSVPEMTVKSPGLCRNTFLSLVFCRLTVTCPKQMLNGFVLRSKMRSRPSRSCHGPRYGVCALILSQIPTATYLFFRL